MKNLLITIIALVLSFSLQAQEESTTQYSGSLVSLNSDFSFKMLEPNQNLRKIDILLNERKNNALENGTLTIGASLIALMDYQKANTDAKFGYLMRHPTANNQIGKTVTEAVLHSFQVSMTAAINSWLTAHTELLYDPQQSFGAGTITALTRNQVQIRKAYMVIGDLKSLPLYFALGKMDTPFGMTNSVSPFTNSTLWHAFGGLAYGAKIGYIKGGVNASFMAAQGGSQFRALHTPVGDSTNVPSQLNNYVADLNYTANITSNLSLKVGASYMHGTSYCQGFPVVHFMPCGDNNPAFTYYAEVVYNDRTVLQGGFAKTTQIWPGTFNPAPPLNQFPASKVSSLDIGIKHQLNTTGSVIYTVSAEFSNFKAGPSGAPWERQNQLVAGLSGMVNNSAQLFVEVFKVDGYAPLNFISGGNLAPGVTHSLNEANTFGIIVGGQLTL